MISIEVTDNYIKAVRAVVRGVEVRVFNAYFRPFRIDCVSNGYISDIPLLAGEIAELLAKEKIRDKDVSFAVNSSTVITQELILPRPWKINNSAAIEASIIANMCINDDYNISYTVTEEFQDEQKNRLIKVMAAVCPRRLLNGYIALGAHLGLNVKQVVPACMTLNTAVLEGAYKAFRSSSIIVAELTDSFLNFNIYCNSKIVYSRYSAVDPADYGFADDFVAQAACKNMEPLLQYASMRHGIGTIDQIFIYGDVANFEMFEKVLSKFGIEVGIVPTAADAALKSEIKYEIYAAAIGALSVEREDFDRYNFKVSAAARVKRIVGSYNVRLLQMTAIIAALSIAAYAGAEMYVNNLITESGFIHSELSSENILERTRLVKEKKAVLDAAEKYKAEVAAAQEILEAQAAVNSEILSALEDSLPEGMKIVGNVLYENGRLTVSFYCGDTVTPSEYVRSLTEQDLFEKIVYTGFSSAGRDYDGCEFSLVLYLKGGAAENE